MNYGQIVEKFWANCWKIVARLTNSFANFLQFVGKFSANSGQMVSKLNAICSQSSNGWQILYAKC